MQDGLLRYPVTGPGGVESLLVGGGLHLLAVYLPVAPFVVVLGYLVAVIVHTASDHDAERHGAPAVVTLPPTREQARRLLVDGLRGTVVCVAYLAVPTVVTAVTVRGVVGGVSRLTAGSGVALLVGGTAALLSAAVFGYPLPAALAAVGRHRRLRPAFDRELLRATATDARYFVGWTTGVAALAMGAAAARPLTAVGVGFFLAFYAEVVAAAQWGWGTSRLRRRGLL
jgi:hypothetical protein